MKTIEQKAKAYDEALERYKAKQEYESKEVHKFIEYIFPELKENEDERIRKALINGFNKLDKSAVWYNGITNAQILAWLEKQRYSEYELENEYWRGYDDGKKQGEQKFSDIDNKFLRMRETKPANIVEFLDRLTTVEQEFLWEHIEKVKKVDREEREQKPVDKVEPKFNEGDWVVSPNGVYWHIDKISNNRYEVTSNTGKGSCSWNLNTNIYHKFTIQDAKDGDVLVDVYGNISIFEKRYGINWHTYCYLENEGRFISEGGSHGSICYPATKEQRDLLFQKMKEEGYVWDAEKKELRKIPKFRVGNTIWKKTDHSNRITILSIDEYFYYANSYNILIEIADKEWELVEQKSADKVEPKFKVGDKIQYLKGCGTIMTIEKIENGEYIFGNNLGHTTIEDGNKWYLVECNPTWSEKDEIGLCDALWCIKQASRIAKDENEMGNCWYAENWLKSLKDRVLPQPKQEWNKEDEDILNTIINHFEIDLECTENDDIIRWLKSLRPQSTWKPSDEQIGVIEAVINNRSFQRRHLDSLYEQLKKLKGK